MAKFTLDETCEFIQEFEEYLDTLRPPVVISESIKIPYSSILREHNFIEYVRLCLEWTTQEES